VPRDQIGVG